MEYIAHIKDDDASDGVNRIEVLFDKQNQNF